MISDIENLKKEIEQTEITDKESLEEFRLRFLSRKGKVQSMFGNMRDVPKEERSRVGKAMNEVKQLAETKFNNQKKILQEKKNRTFGATDDLTLPVTPAYAGSLHPLTQTENEMKNIFLRLGFDVADGPEIEDDFHNFTALNFPPDHPARDMQDTFFIRKSDKGDVQDLVMRTHTSPVQIRLMKEQPPPYPIRYSGQGVS